MRFILTLAAITAVLHAKSFKIDVRSTGSLRAKLITSGQHRQYLDQQRKYRVQNFRAEPLQIMDYADEFYVGEVHVGTPGQRTQLAMGTAVPGSWLIDSNCDSMACNGHSVNGFTRHKFDTLNSSTFNRKEKAFAIMYGYGVCEGYMATDVFSFAGLNIPGQDVGIAQYVNDYFGYLPIDGMFSLAWLAFVADNETTPLRRAFDDLDKPIFTVWLDKKVNLTAGGNRGLFTFGDFDHDHCEEDANYALSTDIVYWQFSIDGYFISSHRQDKKAEAISDTGAPWIGAPQEVIDTVANVTGAKYDASRDIYTVPCDVTETLPDFNIVINGREYAIPSAVYVVDIGLSDGNCVIAFFSLGENVPEPSWVLGATFIRNYCHVYDVGAKQIGFSKAKHTDV
ncbi:eukaryotic aspartyl protease [Ancylostoma caninum]|uniref:Eukaryotic aspartyl protease n=1 Tax=Ancylostoma caninum TaxID=29170 RepID=A0A368FLX8_ANCCA|nr:eukaryotic aspartyl protease [Ancylostoma caninum]